MVRPKYRQSELERTPLPSQDQRLSIPSEGATKVQTDVKAGGGLLGILIDIDIDLGGGCGCGQRKRIKTGSMFL